MAPPSRTPMPLHRAAVEVAAGLLDAGFEAYFAGGCVRDRLLGSEPDDFDIATNARPDDVRRVFPRAQGVGESFGVMLVRHGGHTFEVATFRSDGDYGDGRRPNDVRFTTAEEDAQRRDFTINGLFQHPLTDAVIDFVGGERDLREGTVRAIGDPAARFAEDHLRLLRGVRFAARLGFALDPATSTAMRDLAGKLSLIARERIGGELRRMLEAPSRVRAVQLLEAHALDAPCLGEPARGAIAGLVPQPLAHIGAFPASSEVPVHAVLAAWAIDRHGVSVACGEPGRLAAAWRESLLLSNREEEGMAATLGAVAAAGGWRDATLAWRKRWAAGPQACWAEAILAVSDPALADAIATWRAATDPATIAPAPVLRGDHLIAAGFAPGPRFKGWLELAYDAQLEGRVDSTDAALRLVQALAAGERPG